MKTSLLLTLAGLALAGLAFGLADGRLYNDTAALVDGSGGRPFIYRQFAPLLIRGLMGLGAPIWAATAATVTAGAIGVVWALYSLASAVFPPARARRLAVAAPLFMLPFVAGLFVYDLPSLALFTLGLALLARGRWAAFALLFPVAVYSRETAFLLLGVLALHGRGRLPGPRLAAGLGLLAAAGLAVKIALGLAYAHNPGAPFETHWLAHYAYIKHMPGPSLTALGALAVLIMAALRRWAQLPPFLQAAAVLIPAGLGLYLLFGFPSELRAIGEAFPALYLLAAALIGTRAADLETDASSTPARLPRLKTR